MNVRRMRMAVFAGAVVMVPSLLMPQMDPNATQNTMPGTGQYPQSPQNINQPSGQPGSPLQTGAQATPSTSMRDSLGAPGQTGQQMLDKQFLRAVAQSGIADVKFGMLAMQKGGPEVKDLGQKMVDDHSAMNKELDSVADALGTTVPKKMNKVDQAEYEKLNGLEGKDFDTEYLTYIAQSHHQDLHSFHQEASVAADTDLAEEVVKAMRMMHEHLSLIAKAAADEGITLPPRPPRPATATAEK